MSIVTIKQSKATIDVGSNSSYAITGDDDIILVGDDSTVMAQGSGLIIRAAGGGDLVTIGGGAAVCGANIVQFQAAGVLRELAGSRVDVYADNSKISMSGDDVLGLYGAGDTLTAFGTDDSIRIGGNGQNGASDIVRGLNQGALFEAQNSNVWVSGSNYSAVMTGDDALTAIGAGVCVIATGAGNVLTIGGAGRAATADDEDTVTLQAPGTINALANSSLEVTASDSFVTLAGDDTLGLYGAGNTVAANGIGDAIWIGENGRGAAADVVHGLYAGALFETQGSNVTVDGASYAATMLGDDVLTATGGDVHVSASGARNLLTIGGNTLLGEDFASFADPGRVIVLSGSNVAVSGDGVVANVLAGGGATLTLTGARDRANVAGYGNQIRVGGNGYAGALDVVAFTPPASTASAYATLAGAPNGVTALRGANVRIVGSGLSIAMEGDDRVVAVGGSNIISDFAGAVGGNRVILGPNLAGPGAYQRDEVTLANAGDSVALASNCGADLINAGGGRIAAALGGDDAVSLIGAFRVHVPLAAGHEVISGFGPSDVLVLASHFADAAALLGATGERNGASVIALDATGDTVTLNAVSKATLASYVQQGFVKFG